MLLRTGRCCSRTGKLTSLRFGCTIDVSDDCRSARAVMALTRGCHGGPISEIAPSRGSVPGHLRGPDERSPAHPRRGLRIGATIPVDHALICYWQLGSTAGYPRAVFPPHCRRLAQEAVDEEVDRWCAAAAVTFPSPASAATSSTGSTNASEDFPGTPHQSSVLRNHSVSSGYSSCPPRITMSCPIDQLLPRLPAGA